MMSTPISSGYHGMVQTHEMSSFVGRGTIRMGFPSSSRGAEMSRVCKTDAIAMNNIASA